MTLIEIIGQLESCKYECEAGSLENNIARQELKARVWFLETVLSSSDRLNYKYIVEHVWNGVAWKLSNAQL